MQIHTHFWCKTLVAWMLLRLLWYRPVCAQQIFLCYWNFTVHYGLKTDPLEDKENILKVMQNIHNKMQILFTVFSISVEQLILNCNELEAVWRTFYQSLCWILTLLSCMTNTERKKKTQLRIKYTNTTFKVKKCFWICLTPTRSEWHSLFRSLSKKGIQPGRGLVPRGRGYIAEGFTFNSTNVKLH